MSRPNKTPLFVRKQSGGVFTVVDERVTTGNIWWVDSGQTSQGGDTSGHGSNPDSPFLTIDFAISQCTANNGDIIYVMPGHAETITTAGAITVDVEGISIIGLGEGSDRPTITFSSSDNSASIIVSAASVMIKNIVGICGDDELTNPFHIQAADCILDIEWQDASATKEAAAAILTTADADRLDVKLKYIGFTAGDACVNAIRLVGGSQTRINIDFYGKASTAVVEFKTTAVVDCNVSGYMYNSGTTNFSKSVVDTPTGSTWFAYFYDGGAGSWVSGGSGDALAAGDLSAIKADTAAILIDTAVIGALGVGLTAVSTFIGTEFTIKKAIADKTTIIEAGLLLTAASSVGELILKRVTLQNDSTVTGGNTGGALIYSDDATYPLEVSLTGAVFAASGFVGVDINYPIQTGKKVGIKAVSGAVTGAGSLIISMTFVRNFLGATIDAV